jgi:hypothetical protein
VAAADEIEPHLSDRAWIYMLPRVGADNGPPAQYIVLDASVPAVTVTPRELHRDASLALAGGYGVVRAKDGILILEQGVPHHGIPTAFYGFVYGGRPSQPESARWGPLRLIGVTVHPLSGHLTASRPDISVDMFWRAIHHARHPEIAVFVSPAYRGDHPSFSSRWKRQTDSATWDWLPPAQWGPGRTLRAISVPLNAETSSLGQVDVAIGVTGAGPLLGVPAADRVAGAPSLVRVATLTTGY